jgi:hypothetical protein
VFKEEKDSAMMLAFYERRVGKEHFAAAAAATVRAW